MLLAFPLKQEREPQFLLADVRCSLFEIGNSSGLPDSHYGQGYKVRQIRKFRLRERAQNELIAID